MFYIELTVIAIAALFSWARFSWIHTPPVLYDKKPKEENPTLHDWMQCIVTILLLLAALFIVLFRMSPEHAETFAFSVASGVIGYWLPNTHRKAKQARCVKLGLPKGAHYNPSSKQD